MARASERCDSGAMFRTHEPRDGPMRSLAIRGRSCTPASNAELTDWLRGRVEGLRAAAPEMLIRLSRLAQDLPDATIDDGWLIELELPRDRPQRTPIPSGR